MNSIEASIRNTSTKGDLNSLRKKEEVPAIIYGGKEDNQKISISTLVQLSDKKKIILFIR